jgi:hypothetical protein
VDFDDSGPPVWLTRQELSAREKVPMASLAQWAWKGYGPKYAKFGRHVRYRLSDVIAWENAQFSGGDTVVPADPAPQRTRREVVDQLIANAVQRTDGPRGAAIA